MAIDVMNKETSIIETGVDKLVELVRAKKKISIPDASKDLGVGQVVIEEWADFLEEEGLISIEYKFATPYLTEKKITKQEVQKKEKEFHGKKEGFVRKAEVTLALLDGETENFSKFKDQFTKVKKELGSDLVHVESELKELEKLDHLKKNIDKDINNQEKQYRTRIDGYVSEIEREQKKYVDIIDNISSEEEKLDKKHLETITLREKELSIRKKLQQFQSTISEINKAIQNDESLIDNSQKRIIELKKKASKIKKEISDRKSTGDTLIRESKEHGQKILDIQKTIMDKVEKSKSVIAQKVEEGKSATKKFKEFFNKKQEIEKLIQDMDSEKDKLEEELIGLIRKAKGFHLSSGNTGLKGHVKDLEKTFDNIKKKKEQFEKEAKRLSSLIKI